MNGIIDQLIPPSSVSFARPFRIFVESRPAQNALLVVKTNIVDIYAVCEDKSLRLLAQHQFAARIESVQVIPRPPQGTSSDSIFVSFPECKLCVLEFNWLLNDLVTKSLHFFEREEHRTVDILGEPALMQPLLASDPDGRMVAMRIFSSFMALLPVRELNSTDHIGQSSAARSPDSSVISFVQHVDARLKQVRRLCFLPGFLNPTLAILYDRGSNAEDSDRLRGPVTPSHGPSSKNTLSLMIVAVEPVKMASAKRTGSSDYSFTVINNIDGLPWDCDSLVPLPKPIGGVLITSTNLLLWCDVSSASAPFAVATNSFAAVSFTGRITLATLAKLNIPTLCGSKFLTLGENGSGLRILMVTRFGIKYQLSLARSGRTLGSVAISRLETDFSSPCPSDLSFASQNLIFLATEGGNSQLILLESNTSSNAMNVDAGQPNGPTISPSVSSAVADSDDSAYLASLDLDVKAVQQKALATTTGSAATLQLHLASEFQSLGSISDCTILGISQRSLVALAGAFTDKNRTFHHGSVNLLQQELRPHLSASFNLPDTRKLWTVFIGAATETQYLIASTESSTLVLTTKGGRLVELEESEFYLEGPTSFASSVQLLDGSWAVLQIFGDRARLLDIHNAKLLAEESHLNTRSSIIVSVAAQIGGFWCLTVDGHLQAYRISSAKGIEQVSLPESIPIQSVRAFCFDRERFLFVCMEDGSLLVYAIPSLQLVFSNRAFSRLPVALPNRQASEGLKDSSIPQTLQRVLAIDCMRAEGSLDGDSSDQQAVIIARFESSPSTLGIAVYRVDYQSQCLVRLWCCPVSLGPSHSNAQSLHLSLPITSTESAVYDSNGTYSLIISIGQNGRPCLHRFGKWISAAKFNASSLISLAEKGQVSVVDWAKTRRDWNGDIVPGWYLKRLTFKNDRIPLRCATHPVTGTLLIASAPLNSDFVLPADEYAPISDGQARPEATEACKQQETKRSPGGINQLHLLHPHTWTVVDETSINAEDSPFNLPYEEVTEMLTAPLATSQSASGFHPLVLLGTANMKSEDRPCRGRILAFDVAEVVPEPGKPETGVKLRLRGVTELKGPVTALCLLPEGHLVVGSGQKTLVCGPEEDVDEPGKLTPVAFIDQGSCCTSAASVKNFFTVGDLRCSMAFMAFQSEPVARIFSLGRDFGQNLQLNHVELLVGAGGNVLQVGADDQGGLHFFSYAPKNLTTNSGQRLLDRGAFWLHGSPINKLLRLPVNSNGDLGLLAFGQDGSAHLIAPLASNVFRRLYGLETRLPLILPSSAGLATRAARQVPRRVNVTHMLPVQGHTLVLLPTSSMTSSSNGDSNDPAMSSSIASSTLILYHLPVSTTFVDGAAVARFFSDSLIDGLARQTLANRFGLDYNELIAAISEAAALKNLF